jgi:hypothetical protein
MGQWAKRKGTKFGRPSALDDGEKRKIAERYAKGETMAQLSRRVRVRRGDRLEGHPRPFRGRRRPVKRK